ncbi:MAG: hypothetical protein WBG02_12100 [Candidatus Acidiferrum sp.]
MEVLTALLTSLAALAGALLFALLAAAVGWHFLTQLGLKFAEPSEQLLVAAAIGTVGLELGIFVAQMTGHILAAILVLLVSAAIYGFWTLQPPFVALASVARRIANSSRSESLLSALFLVLALWEGIAATAPLTGSDALFYHFRTPLDTLQFGFHPNFFLANSFFVGQGHGLILFGLALGSEKLSLAILWFGGVLASLSVVCLARRWTSAAWAMSAGLSFLACPVVMWQITAAGTADLWTAMLTVAALLAVINVDGVQTNRHAIVAGILAGGIAGAKYSNCAIAAMLFLAFVMATRSAVRSAVFFVAAVLAGIGPYLRNLIWTGDPFFPLGIRWLAPGRINTITLEAMRADTGSIIHSSFVQMIGFPFFVRMDVQHLGLWDFFGPLVLVFAPFVLPLLKRERTSRPAALVWIGSAVAMSLASRLSRFLLPLLPVALALSFAGLALAIAGNRRAVLRALSVITVALFVALGVGAAAAYTRPALGAALGLTSRDDYLRERAPNYELSLFVNQTLGARNNGKSVLVFFHHLYYLRVPYRYGDPIDSWAIDPSRLRTAEDWRQFLQKENIGWVLRAPEYPEAIAKPLEELQAEGELVPVAQKEVTDFAGNRIVGQHTTFVATLFATAN